MQTETTETIETTNTTETIETFKTIPGYQDYMLSNHNRVLSFKRCKDKGKILKPQVQNGYCFFVLYNQGRQRVNLLHLRHLVDSAGLYKHTKLVPGYKVY